MPRFLLIIALVASAMLLGPSLAAEEPASPAATAESRYQTAVRLFGEGRYREALDEFDQAIILSPESIFYCNRAIVLIKLREPQEALESLATCQKTHTGGTAELAEIDAQRQAVAVLVEHVRPGVLGTVSAMNAPVQEGPKGWTRTETGILLLGIGGAAVASALTLDFVSKGLKADLDQAARRTDEARYETLLGDYKARRRIWIGLAAGGALFTATGAVLVLSRLLSNPSDEVEVGVTLRRPGLFVRYHW